MTVEPHSLWSVYEGWEGYNTSLARAIEPLTEEQLAFRAAPDQRSVIELGRHIALGRLNWFVRMPAPGSLELAARIPEWRVDPDGNRHIVDEAVSADKATVLRWFADTWSMVERTLNEWTVADLAHTYRHTYRGQTYAISRQWTIWRMMAHDIHHGGQLTLALYLQGIVPFELGALGGHLTESPLADPPS